MSVTVGREGSNSSPWADIPGLIGLSELMAIECGHPDVMIAVLDGPVHLEHAVFASTVLLESPSKQRHVTPQSDHGTHITSIVTGRDGIAPGCKVLSIPVYHEDEQGRLSPCSQFELAMAIEGAISAGAHIINISGGILTPSGRGDGLLEQAVKRCVEKNILIVAAAGNDGCDCVHVPASLPGVLAIGAADLNGKPLDFSNFGATFHQNGILAPGENIPGAVPPNGSLLKSGTSFATPIVTAVAALLISQHYRRSGIINPGFIRDLLLECAVGKQADETFEENRALRGRLNVPCAVLKILNVKDARQDAYQPSFFSSKDLRMPHNNFTADTVSPSDADTDLLKVIDTVISHSEATPPVIINSPAPPLAVPALITPSDCGCSPVTPSVANGQLVFALGQLSYDFGSEARMDYFIQQMGGAADIMNPVKMATRLQEADKGGESHTDEAEALIWTLNIDDTPVYAIEPDSQFAVLAYLRLVEFLFQQEKQGVERVSIAGRVKGKTRLYNGTIVPSISPTLRGMYNWNVDTLVQSVLETVDDLGGDEQTKVRARISEFLNRIYYEMRNPGMTAENRAMNFAATNAFHTGPVFKEMAGQDMVLDRIRVERSPICRPDSDCWDVIVTFFNPARIMDQARKVYRITVDVSDTVPVTVGETRSWYVYFGQN